MKARALLLPWLRGRICPSLLSAGNGERPIVKISDMREYLHGRTARIAILEIRESRGRIADGFASTVCDYSNCMTKELTRGIRHKHLPSLRIYRDDADADCIK